MYLKTIKELAYKRYTEYSDSDIKESECAVEAYFNRLIFIGLRLQGVKYKQCQEIIKNTFIHEKESLKKHLNHSAFDQPKERGAKNSQRDFTEDEIKRFKLGKEAKNPIKYEEAKQKFDSIMRGI